ncbi:MAG: RsmE family RNA methyltransferase [Sphaerochaeta sp.]|uniref:RsmE family RNA methyltransferase n=1 Tax=Sphaerochaeta sp. TaxID=1972642 RepID=UPI002973B3B5|nr:RsmE family RNA methyltransferase [uncultured Sphaerochaeta sp.]MDD3057417.1 RsmE family RNA methyltransferase [Sphaerochaeta sp.]MDD3928196.1 RsmE family RNA methyltransferase [Sphaerochaeta sp.]
MRQYLLPPGYQGENSLVLEGKESQYLTKVLRLKIGQQILGRDAKGKRYVLKLTDIARHSCTLSCTVADDQDPVQSTDELPSFQGPYPNLVLLQCLCKGKKEEQIVRQATEIGVHTIALVSSRYCVTDLSDKKESALSSRFDRLEAQIKEAIQQSGSPVPTQLERRVIPLSELPSWWNGRGLGLFFHQSSRPNMQQTLASLVRTLPSETPVAVLIGPEGGFSEEECEFLENHGFTAVLLRTNILRSETAGIYALSALQVLMTESLQ